MPSQTFQSKVGDTGPAIQSTLRDWNGVVVDVTGATIKFKMKMREPVRGRGGLTRLVGLKVDGVGAIVNGTGGIVNYQWVAGDLDTPGTYDAEWEITFGSGIIETFPRPGFIVVLVEGDLDYIAAQ